MARLSRASRQSNAAAPIPTLEHDAIAVALQESLGARVLLIRVIGEGGMGRVYLGRDPQLKRFVAVKVLLQSLGADAEAHARFQREAQAIAAVSHANVVAIYGVGELPDGTPYFIMQHVAGGSMAERLAASGPLPIDVAEGVLGDVAAALAAAHRRGIVHRDVKPANVLWDEDGERATVSDFGIASLQESDGDEGDMRITASGMAVGSPAYMSPEQLLTEPITPKSDIYALGLLGYELLTARGPYTATSPSDIVAAHLRDSPRRLSELRPDVPPNLEALLLRCLSKSPTERPTADDVMLALTPGAADALEWPPPGLERARGALWRLMLMPAAGTVLLLFPLLLSVWLGTRGVSDGAEVWPFFLAATSLLGFAAFVRAGSRAWRLRRVVSRAAVLGYGWGTVAEVFSDRRGDSGSLIAGTREYAALSPAERGRLRVLRVVSATLLFLASPVAVLVALVAFRLRGGQHGGDTLLVGAVLWTLTVLAVGGVAAEVPEQARLASVRRRRAERSHHTSEMELAPAWYAAFERSRAGQPFGPGRQLSRLLAVTLATVGTVVVVACAAILLATCMVTVVGQLTTSAESSFTGNPQTNQAQRLRGGTAFRLPPDGHVTPLDAGDALLTIQSTVQRRPPSPIEHPASADYPPWHRITPPHTLFAGSSEVPWTTGAILAASKGLTPGQRVFLDRAAAHPAREEFSRAALASSVDVYGALLKLPLAARITPFDYPTLYLSGVNDAAESHAARVALDIADRRPADAERHAREIIAVGALMIDLHLVSASAAGVNVLTRGVGSLEAVYVATGRERDARVLLDTMLSTANQRDRFAFGRGADQLQRVMHDARRLRSARFDTLFPLLARSCADPAQLLFGVDEQFRRTVGYARDSLARFPSERAWVEGMGAWMAGETSLGDGESGAMLAMARAVDWVVGGHRFANCTAVSRVRLVF